MKLNLNKVPGYGNAKKMATMAAAGQIIKKFNEIIKELEKIKKQGTKYSNYKYWHKFDLLFFDSKTDRKNMKELTECIKQGTLTQEHIDYIAGAGQHKGNGLMDYIITCRNDKFTKLIDATGEDSEKEIIKKADDIEEKLRKYEKTAPIPKSVTEKFKKKVSKILKKGGIA